MRSASKFFVLILLLAFASTLTYKAFADGTYNDLGTADSADGSNDAINFSQGRVWTIDSYGKYIWLTQGLSGPTSHWAWSNDEGANWSQGAENYTFLTRASVAYDSNNDKLHVIWAATDSNDGIIYRRYGITRDGSNNITAIAREDAPNINLQLDTTSSRTLEQPVALWIDDGTTNGILVAVWSKSGSGLAEVRASMRRLSLSDADGDAISWESLDGTGDTFGTDAPAVEADKIFTSGSGSVSVSAAIRGGTGSRKDDLYVFVAHSTGGSGDLLRSYRADWDSVDLDWSDGWQSPVTVGAMDTSAGYGLKHQLITQPVIDTTSDRLYVGWARWKAGGDGDTVSMAYLNATDTPSSTVDIYAAGGTHSYAPTLGLSYDSVQDFIYASYVLSTTNGDNGSIEYKTYDGTTLSSATKFYTTPGGSAGENGSADIPVTYSTRYDDKLLYGFRVNGSLPPSGPEPHTIYWGYITLPTAPQIQFTSSSSSGAESVTSVNIPVSLSGTFTRDSEVDYAVTSGSATGSGTDYTLASGTLTISAGDTSENIVLSVVNDSTVESSENLIITLSSPVFSSLGSNTTFTYTITDNDVAVADVATDISNKKAKSSSSCTSRRPRFMSQITSVSVLNGNSLAIEFKDKNVDVDSYTLEYRNSAGTNSRKVHINSKTVRSYTLHELAENTQYILKIRANNLCKSGPWSENYTIRTSSALPKTAYINNPVRELPTAGKPTTVKQQGSSEMTQKVFTKTPEIKSVQDSRASKSGNSLWGRIKSFFGF